MICFNLSRHLMRTPDRFCQLSEQSSYLILIISLLAMEAAGLYLFIFYFKNVEETRWKCRQNNFLPFLLSNWTCWPFALSSHVPQRVSRWGLGAEVTAALTH